MGELCRGGDYAAFDRTYRTRVRGLAVRLVGDAEADDLTQEVMLRAARQLAENGYDSEPWSWLAIVCRRLAIDHVRRTARTMVVADEELADAVGAAPDDPSDAAIRADARRRLSGALQRLPATDRTILVRHEVDGATAASLAASLGVSGNAMRQRLFRARRSLAAHYQQLGGHSLGVVVGRMRSAVVERVPRRLLDGPVLEGRGRGVIATLAVVGSMSIGVAPSAPSAPDTPAPRPAASRPSPPPRERPLRAAEQALAGVTRLVPVPSAVPAPTVPAEPLRWTRHSGPAPEPRYWAAAANDAGQQETVLFGGRDDAGVFGDTWVWDGARWTRRTPERSPSARHGATMAYDRARGEIVLFGGRAAAGQFLNDTWVWDGETWTQRLPIVAPRPRARATMGYDPVAGTVLLFGGEDNGAFSDTWTWNGTTWSQVTTATGPLGRFGAMLAYDPAAGQLLLSGGQDAWQYYDAWSWTGTGWRPLLPNVPPDDLRPHLHVAPLADAVVTFDGPRAWVWTGALWRPAPASGGPQPRPYAVAAYDVARSEIVFFGGWGGNGAHGDTWTATFGRRISRERDDRSVPVSVFTTEGGARLSPGEVLRGRTNDAGRGVAVVYVVFTPILGNSAVAGGAVTVMATLTCARPTTCTWTVAPPDRVGTYLATARATDRAGHTEAHGPAIRFTRNAI
ncbi:MAG TPA: sigma-70 family RNA polymerase sigma factor [Frankiaceae bacterium]|nr:sigma-70 family RNA polymerase sigma factor [Frankiaceae bacterium]